ncbi:MAG: type II toxin-antitoxin system Phd/YefM family antitoxin [Lachnospiraceae bacterium]|nr:type II toxin-antitoxin system Phd/YefM family antitoxin [Lachnospiraceae bacterium]
MNNVVSAINNTIPITLFNKGAAGKIFDEVKKTGAKVVMKNNIAECVLISPEDYVEMVDELNDAKLLTMATERLAHFSLADGISEEEIDKRFGFTPDMLADGEVEFE